MFDELFHRNSPVFDPPGLPAHHQGTDAFPLGCPYFICANAFDQPDSTVCWNAFVQALLEENLAADAVGYRSAESSERNSRVREVLQPYLPLGVGQGDSGRGLEGGWRRNLSVVP